MSLRDIVLKMQNVCENKKMADYHPSWKRLV